MYFIRDYNGPKLYQPSDNPEVLILGQDPTVDRKKRFDTVLGFEKQSGSLEADSKKLQDYIRNRILKPLGIDENRIIATNLINAYYYDVPNKVIAKAYKDLILSTAQEKGIDMTKYPDKTNGAILHALNFKSGFRTRFEEKLALKSVAHVITLGEPVYQVIRERYGLYMLPAKIREVLEAHRESPPRVTISGKEVSLLPLPHIFNEDRRKWEFYFRYMKEVLPKLARWYKG